MPNVFGVFPVFPTDCTRRTEKGLPTEHRWSPEENKTRNRKRLFFLLDGRQGFYVELEGLVVLALNLELGLQLLDEKFKARDFGF